MAKNAYIGVDGKARKVKKMYIGVNGVARKIKKAYIGVGGVARLCWSGGDLAYHGTIETFTQWRGSASATSVGNYALFAGGTYSYTTIVQVPGYGNVPSTTTAYTKTVEVYDKSLTHSTAATSLTEGRSTCGAASNGNYAIFAAGHGDGQYVYNTSVEAYNSSLTHFNADNVTSEKHYMGSATVGNYALFAGGYSGLADNSVDAYDKSLTHKRATNLRYDTCAPAGASVGDYALFAGGHDDNTMRYYVYAYNSSLTMSTATNLKEQKDYANGISFGDYAMFTGDKYNASTEVYNASLTRSTITPLSQIRYNSGAAVLGDYAIIACGTSNGTAQTNTVDIYDKSLTLTTGNFTLSVARNPTPTVTIGNYALFSGFVSSTSGSGNIVEAFTIG